MTVTQMPLIDQQKCNLCGLCISVCACGAIVLVNNIVTIIETEDCHWCTICEAVCPTAALTCAFEIVIEEP
jgi:MinD superfamily P-loop ATPase